MNAVHIETNQSFSKSYLWKAQRDFYQKQTIDVWSTHQVPFYITSNPFIANAYANIIASFIKDCILLDPLAMQHPFYILELGAGCGQFSFYCLKRLLELLDQKKLKTISLCYIASDIVQDNIDFLKQHPALKKTISEKKLDFSVYDLCSDNPIFLTEQKKALTEKDFYNPLTVISNYVFDCIPQDIFQLSEGELNESLVSLKTEKENWKNDKPIALDKINIEYTEKNITDQHYAENSFNQLLSYYRSALIDTHFSFPITALRAIEKFKQLAGDRLLLLVSDKGYTTLEELEYLDYPDSIFHSNSFSMMLNFHAIGEYFKQCGGYSILPTPRKLIKTAAFSFGFDLNEMLETKPVISQHLEDFNLSNYYALYQQFRESFESWSVNALVSYLAMNHWDPHIYHTVQPLICNQIDENEFELMEYLSINLPKVAELYYWLPESVDIYFEVAIFYHAIKNYEKALYYYQQSQALFEPAFSLLYNAGLCYYHLHRYEEALSSFQKALDLEPYSPDVKNWIEAIQEKDRSNKMSFALDKK